jgi:predicted nucleotidyltransferase
MVDENTIRRAAEALLEAAPTGSTVILIGSFAEGTAQTDSDLDFLVIEPSVKSRLGEMARLSRLLGDMLIPADVIVTSRGSFRRFRNTPNTIAYEAAKKGKVYEHVS